MARRDARVVPRELQNAEGLQHRKDETGVARPVEATYEVRVALEAVDIELLNRMRGEAKIDAAPQTIVETTIQKVIEGDLIPLEFNRVLPAALWPGSGPAPKIASVKSDSGWVTISIE